MFRYTSVQDECSGRTWLNERGCGTGVPGNSAVGSHGRRILRRESGRQGAGGEVTEGEEEDEKSEKHNLLSLVSGKDGP